MYKYILISLFCLACSSSNGTGYGVKGNITQKDDPDLCEAACKKAKDLNCAEGKDLVYPGSSCVFDAECENGKCITGKCTETCVDVCSAFVIQGRSQSLACWTTITECGQIESVCRN